MVEEVAGDRPVERSSAELPTPDMQRALEIEANQIEAARYREWEREVMEEALGEQMSRPGYRLWSAAVFGKLVAGRRLHKAWCFGCRQEKPLICGSRCLANQHAAQGSGHEGRDEGLEERAEGPGREGRDEGLDERAEE